MNGETWLEKLGCIVGSLICLWLIVEAVHSCSIQ
jgi:hypothetical protein